MNTSSMVASAGRSRVVARANSAYDHAIPEVRCSIAAATASWMERGTVGTLSCAALVRIEAAFAYIDIVRHCSTSQMPSLVCVDADTTRQRDDDNDHVTGRRHSARIRTGALPDKCIR